MRTGLIAMIHISLSSLIAVFVINPALTFAEDATHPDVAVAQKRFQLELQKAFGPVFKRHTARLEELQKTLTRKGDLNGAIQIKKRNRTI